MGVWKDKLMNGLMERERWIKDTGITKTSDMEKHKARL